MLPFNLKAKLNGNESDLLELVELLPIDFFCPPWPLHLLAFKGSKVAVVKQKGLLMNPWLLFLSYSISNSESLNTGPLQEFNWKPGSVAWGLESLSCTEYRTNEMWNQTQDAHLICCKAVTLPRAPLFS